MSEKKIHNYTFGQMPEMPWKSRKVELCRDCFRDDWLHYNMCDFPGVCERCGQKGRVALQEAKSVLVEEYISGL